MKKEVKKKKVKILTPTLFLETLEKDVKHFGITKEKLCNEILIRLNDRYMLALEREFKSEEKKFLQFNLNKKGSKFYSSIVTNHLSTNESEIMRSILAGYINLNPFIREWAIFEEKIVFFEHLEREQNEIKVLVNDSFYIGKVKGIERCKETDYIVVKLGNRSEYLSRIKFSSIIKEGKINWMKKV